MTGGRTVDHDRVPLTAAFELLDLAEYHEVVDPRGGGGNDVDDPGGGEPLGHATETVLAEVLLEGERRRQGEQRHVADEFGEGRLAIQFDGDDAAAGVGGRAGEKRRYRGLADSPLPGDDGDLRRGEQRHDVHGLRRHLCAD